MKANTKNKKIKINRKKQGITLKEMIRIHKIKQQIMQNKKV